MTANNTKQDHTSDNNSPAQQDLKVALVILLIAAFLLMHTLSFPMSGSYGGVENQWFVSPALFPLMIIFSLLLCSGILLIKAARSNGFTQFTETKTWFGNWQHAPVQNRYFVIWTLLFFVYICIPSIDFYLACVLFLASLTHHFYYPSKKSVTLIPLLQLSLSLVLLSIKLSVNAYEDSHWLNVNQDELVILYSDSAAATAIIILCTWNGFKPVCKDSKRWLKQSFVIFFVPLILIMIFTFLLYVPMPVEYGSVSTFLNYIVYDLMAGA